MRVSFCIFDGLWPFPLDWSLVLSGANSRWGWWPVRGEGCIWPAATAEHTGARHPHYSQSASPCHDAGPAPGAECTEAQQRKLGQAALHCGLGEDAWKWDPLVSKSEKPLCLLFFVVVVVGLQLQYAKENIDGVQERLGDVPTKVKDIWTQINMTETEAESENINPEKSDVQKEVSMWMCHIILVMSSCWTWFIRLKKGKKEKTRKTACSCNCGLSLLCMLSYLADTGAGVWLWRLATSAKSWNVPWVPSLSRVQLCPLRYGILWTKPWRCPVICTRYSPARYAEAVSPWYNIPTLCESLQ